MGERNLGKQRQTKWKIYEFQLIELSLSDSKGNRVVSYASSVNCKCLSDRTLTINMEKWEVLQWKLLELGLGQKASRSFGETKIQNEIDVVRLKVKSITQLYWMAIFLLIRKCPRLIVYPIKRQLCLHFRAAFAFGYLNLSTSMLITSCREVKRETFQTSLPLQHNDCCASLA